MSKMLNPGDHVLGIPVGSRNRQYLLHVTPTCNDDSPLPLVFVFHGGGGTAKIAAFATGFSQKADRERFFVVYPEALRPDPSRPVTLLRNPAFWNVGTGIGYAQRENVDDVGFIRALLDELPQRFAVDSRRIYAAGFSNGASMVFQAAMELPERFAAIAPVSGHLWRRQPRPTCPISMIYIVGNADPLNPLDGGMVELPWGELERRPPIADSVETWATWIGCAPRPCVISDRDGVQHVRYGPGEQGAEVVFITIADAGHVWPGGPEVLAERITGKRTDKLNATDVIWDFFQQH